MKKIEKNTAEFIQDTVSKINDGTKLIDENNTTFKKAGENAAYFDELIQEIASTSSEQNCGIGEVLSAVAKMDRITRHNAANSEETSSASLEMLDQAEQMKQIVADLVVLVNGLRIKRSKKPVGAIRRHR